MKYFAEIDNNNIVTRVCVFNDSIQNEEEAKQITPLFQNGIKWIETSLDGSIRKNSAGIGYIYDENRDSFISPKPFNSWILNETTCKWEAPISQPDRYCFWNENTQNWI
jgi:hypothetical protein